MSLIVSWIGVDTHGTTSAYIAGDSRITWKGLGYFDYGRKVFASSRYPEILGYAGDVLFPSIVLSQIIGMIENDILISENYTCKQKYEAIKEKLVHSFQKYPKDIEGITNPILQVIHISKDTIVKKYPDYFCHLIEWRKGSGWRGKKINIPKESGILSVLGSGKDEFLKNYERYQNSKNKSTSRNVFHCFCDTLFNIKNPNCGGPPQLVGIYRKLKTSGINFGIIRKRKRYFLGTEVPKVSYYNNIEWRNDLFELCDGNAKKRISSAIKQPDVLRRK